LIEFTKDFLGQRVEIGDTISASFVCAKTPALRVGTVVGFGERQDGLRSIDLMEIEWIASSLAYDLPSSKTSKIEVRHKRFLKIDLNVGA